VGRQGNHIPALLDLAPSRRKPRRIPPRCPRPSCENTGELGRSLHRGPVAWSTRGQWICLVRLLGAVPVAQNSTSGNPCIGVTWWTASIPGCALHAEQWSAMWADLIQLMGEGVRRGRIDTVRPEHDPILAGRALRQDRHGGEVYVYRRAGAPCLVCGTTVVTKQHGAATSTGVPAASDGQRLSCLGLSQFKVRRSALRSAVSDPWRALVS
jgi:hypothetical protein